MKTLKVFYLAGTDSAYAIVELANGQITFASIENDQIVKVTPARQAPQLAARLLKLTGKMTDPRDADYFPKVARAYYQAVGIKP